MKLSDLNKEIEKIESILSEIKPILKKFSNFEDDENLSDEKVEELMDITNTLIKINKELDIERV